MVSTAEQLSTIGALTDLAARLQEPLSLEQILQAIADTAAQVLAVDRTSVRLLDPTRRHLMAIARAGGPLHQDANFVYRLGEGLMGWIAQEGKPLRLSDADRDPRFAERPGMKAPIRSFLGVPLLSGNACLGVLSAVSDRNDVFDTAHQELLTLLATISAPHVEIARLSRLYNVDPLTGALNQKGLEDAFASGTIAAPLSLVVVDTDGLAGINEQYGHALGDEVLRRIAALLAQTVRAGDAVVRYQGEAFLLILPAVSLETAGRVAERAREAVLAAALPFPEAAAAVTISAGVAEMRSGESRSALIDRASDALRSAKRSGRNRVMLAS